MRTDELHKLEPGDLLHVGPFEVDEYRRAAERQGLAMAWKQDGHNWIGSLVANPSNKTP